jgi:hypothetical protein
MGVISGLHKQCPSCGNPVLLASTTCWSCGQDVTSESWVYASLEIPLDVAAKKSAFATATDKAAEMAQAVISAAVDRAVSGGWQVVGTSDFLDLAARGQVDWKPTSDGATTFTRVVIPVKLQTTARPASRAPSPSSSNPLSVGVLGLIVAGVVGVMSHRVGELVAG